MKIKIIKARKNVWYENRVGEIFKVIRQSFIIKDYNETEAWADDIYVVRQERGKDTGVAKDWYIFKEDAEVVK